METETLDASSALAMEQASAEDEAQQEADQGNAGEARPEGTAPDDDDEEDDDDDDINVHIGAINSSPAASGANPNFNRRFSKGGGGAAAAAKAAAAATTAAGENGDAVEKQKTTIDLGAEGKIYGIPVKEFDLDSILDKPWRKPGADITDYFNYGFNEETWKAYCTKQQSLRVANGLPAIGHPNFAPDKNSLPSSGGATSLMAEAVGSSGGPKKPLVIDMNKIREKFNILGDRAPSVPTQPIQKPRNAEPKQSGAGTSSIAVIGGSDSTSRRIPSSQDSSNFGIPTLGGSGSALGATPQKASGPFLPGLDMSRPPPGFPPMGGPIPTGPPPPHAPPSFPPAVGAAVPPYGAPPPFGDPFPTPTSAMPGSFPPPPMGGPPGAPPAAVAPVPSGWPPHIPPAGPPPLGYPAAAPGGGAPAAAPPGWPNPNELQRSVSPTVKEEDEEEDKRERGGEHSHHRSSSPDNNRSRRSRSPSSSRSSAAASKEPSSSSSKHRSSGDRHHHHHHRDKDRKRSADEQASGADSGSSSSSRSHHKKSKKSDRDKDGHRRNDDEVKREVE